MYSAGALRPPYLPLIVRSAVTGRLLVLHTFAVSVMPWLQGEHPRPEGNKQWNPVGLQSPTDSHL